MERLGNIVGALVVAMSSIVAFTSLAIPVGVRADGFADYSALLKAKTPKEYGMMAGKTFGSFYKDVISTCFSVLGDQKMANFESDASLVMPYLRGIPEEFEMYEGLSDCLGIPIELLVAVSLALSSLFSSPSCTTCSAVPPATTGGEIITAWNLDETHMMKPLMDLLVKVGPFFPIPGFGKHYTFVGFGVPILATLGLLNERGLACVQSAEPTDDAGIGIPALWLNNLALWTCENVHEVADLMGSLPRLSLPDSLPIVGNKLEGYTCLLNSNMLFTDYSGGIVAIEWSHSYFEPHYGVSPHGLVGIQVQTNNYQYIDRNVSGCPYYTEPGEEGWLGSYMREAR